MNSLSPRKPLQIITNVIGTQIHRLSTSLSPNKNLKWSGMISNFMY